MSLLKLVQSVRSRFQTPGAQAGGRADALADAAPAFGPAEAIDVTATLAYFLDNGRDLDALSEATVRQPAGSILLDISDLLIFGWDHGFVTGIQRVQLELIAALRGGSGLPPAAADARFCFAEFDRPWRMDPGRLKDLLDYFRLGEVDLDRARGLIERAKANAVACRPGEGSAYLVLGAFWSECVAEGLCDTVKAAGGRFGVMIHDLFPITLNAIAEEGAAKAFEARLRQGLARWDFIVTNSQYTAGEVRGYLERTGAGDQPVIALPLAHAVPRTGAAAPLPGGLTAGGFVLCVGTIEPRKNHDVLIGAWRTLGRAHANLPILVLVGREGWRNGALVEALRSGGLAGEKVVWLENVSDAELNGLYRACLFTVYPSLAEGWGLPVGEALGEGKVCLTSPLSAIPEAGGDLALYVDPTDQGAMAKALDRLIYEPETLKAQERVIAEGFRARTWPDVARDLVRGLSNPETSASAQGR